MTPPDDWTMPDRSDELRNLPQGSPPPGVEVKPEALPALLAWATQGSNRWAAFTDEEIIRFLGDAEQVKQEFGLSSDPEDPQAYLLAEMNAELERRQA